MQAVKPVTKPSKQRKMLYQAPSHIRYKFFSARLSPELRKAHGAKTLPVRRGDTVRIMRGDHKGLEGKVTRVDRKKYRIFIEGLTREKVDGTTTFVPIHPSKVMITRLNLDDKWRNKILKRKKKIEEVAKVPEVAEAEKKVEEIVKPPEVAEVVEEKVVAEEKPKRRKKRKITRKKGEEKAGAEETGREVKPKAKKAKVKRKTAEKTEEEK